MLGAGFVATNGSGSVNSNNHTVTILEFNEIVNLLAFRPQDGANVFVEVLSGDTGAFGDAKLRFFG